MAAEAGRPPLLQRVSRAMFWNALFLPLTAALNLGLAVLIRRTFALDSGIYDALIGLLNTLLFYSSLGIPETCTRFIPELEERGAFHAIRRLVATALTSRLALLAAALAVLNFLAAPLSQRLALGPDGTTYIFMLSGLALVRAVYDIVLKVLQAFLAHFWTNLLAFLQALLVPALLVWLLARGGSIEAILFAMTAVVGALLLVAARRATVVYRQHAHGGLDEAAATAGAAPANDGDATPPEFPETSSTLAASEADARSAASIDAPRFARFAGLMYFFNLANYFASAAFAVLAVSWIYSDPAPVAIFNAGLQLPTMIVVLAVSSFQGLYRPMFARLLAGADATRLRTAFVEVSKVQLVLLFPAGTGLAIMVGDYVPLLFGAEFSDSVAVARVLTGFLFAETALNLGAILLSTAERGRLVLLAQGTRLLAAPGFVVALAFGGLVEAAAAFGAVRLAAAAIGYLLAASSYGVRFPWAFAARAALPSAAMAALLIGARNVWTTSWPEALCLTAAGVAVVVVSMRLFRLLGKRELDLLARSSLPGSALLIRWLAPSTGATT